MRKVYKEQMEIGETGISDIGFDLGSRDEIPKLLMGLQHIYTDKNTWNEVHDILENVTPAGVDPDNGREGMDYWQILVLATLKLNCKWDYDKLKEIADNHIRLRQMLGHSILDYDKVYALQTLKDNVALLTPELLDNISQVVVKSGHRLLGKSEEDPIHARCDSSVVRTNIHHPTDISVLLDAMRVVIRLVSRICAEEGITWWRQSNKAYKNLKKKYRKAQNLKKSNSEDPKKVEQKKKAIDEAYRAYLETSVCFLLKAVAIVEYLRNNGYRNEFILQEIDRNVGHAERQIDQTYRRVILDEKIPHEEKVFSIFEEHTEWISKGKAGVPQELGLSVCFLEDQYGFIIHHQVMERQADADIAVPFIEKAKGKHPNLFGCSFDKGFYTPENRRRLYEFLDKLTLPKKGRLSKKDKTIEYSEEFIKARRQHSAVESAINALQNHGLDRCPDRGLDGFKRYVSLAVLARNIQIMGHIIQQQEKKRQERIAKYRATWIENRKTNPEKQVA